MPVLADDELLAWLRLTLSPGVGNVGARRLLAVLGSPQAVLAADVDTWRELAGPAAMAGLGQACDDIEALLAPTRAWLEADPQQRHIITWGDVAYPQALLNTADPPPMLYAQGHVDLLNRPSVAVVGSRHATAQGRDNARAFARSLSQAGLTVVSGMALGIDAAAHEGALEGAGRTVAVVGTGLDRVYPKQHLALARRIADSGVLISEFTLGTPALAVNFPRRNRLIAGMSLGTLVVEAAVQSGSLITARLAAECGREVFAIPGSIHLPQSRGSHRLIQQGAKLVETVDDILQELRWPGAPAGVGSAAPVPVGGPADSDAGTDVSTDAVLLALGHDPATLDALIARCGWPAPALSAHLLELELDGRVARLPGGLYQRRVST